MKFLTLYLCSTLWLSKSLASVLAGKWQAIFMFYAYRMELAQNYPDPWIATGCPGGNCNFDDFLKHIQRSSQPWTGSTNIRNDMHPNPVTAAAELDNAGYVFNVDPDKVAPGYFTRAPDFATLMDAVMQAVDRVRKDTKDVCSGYLDDTKNVMNAIHDARRDDFNRFYLPDLRTELARFGATMFTQKWPSPWIPAYDVIEPTQTIASAPLNQQQAVNDRIRDYIAIWSKPSPNNRNAAHFNAITYCQTLETRLWSPVPGGC